MAEPTERRMCGGRACKCAEWSDPSLEEELTFRRLACHGLVGMHTYTHYPNFMSSPPLTTILRLQKKTKRGLYFQLTICIH